VSSLLFLLTGAPVGVTLQPHGGLSALRIPQHLLDSRLVTLIVTPLSGRKHVTCRRCRYRGWMFVASDHGTSGRQHRRHSRHQRHTRESPHTAAGSDLALGPDSVESEGGLGPPRAPGEPRPEPDSQLSICPSPGGSVSRGRQTADAGPRVARTRSAPTATGTRPFPIEDIAESPAPPFEQTFDPASTAAVRGPRSAAGVMSVVRCVWLQPFRAARSVQPRR